MSSREAVVDILKKAYQIEVDGYTFYSMTADRADKPAVRELFAKLASDEMQHQAFLRDVLKHYDDKGAAAFSQHHRPPELRAFAQQVFSDNFRAQAAGAAFETAVLSVGMTLESRAIACFTDAAEGASEKEVKDFYQFLAGWEKQHLEALNTLYGMVRADFWQQSGFAPF
jgi:rubrerythrin